MPSTKNHHVIEAFSPNRADQSLGKGILPGTAGCGDDFFYSQRLYAAAKPVAVNRVAIPDQVMLGVTIRKGFHDLLRGPLGGWMLGDAEMQDSSPLMLQDQKHKQHPQSDRRHGKEINRNDFAEMIPQEGSPGLRRRSFDRLQDTRHGALRNRDSQFLQFPMNPRRAPGDVRQGHRLNQLSDLSADRGPACSSRRLRQLRPVAAETFSLPMYYRVGNGPPSRLDANPSTPPRVQSKTSGHPRLSADACVFVCRWKVAGGGRDSPGQPRDDLCRTEKPTETDPGGRRACRSILSFYLAEKSMPSGRSSFGERHLGCGDAWHNWAGPRPPSRVTRQMQGLSKAGPPQRKLVALSPRRVGLRFCRRPRRPWAVRSSCPWPSHS